jgi:hypothetical protein
VRLDLVRALEVRGEPAQLALAACHQHDVVAVAGEEVREVEADAAGGSGDQCRLSLHAAILVQNGPAMKRALAVLVLLFASRAAFACSCVGPPSVEEARRHSSIVFAGVVESIQDMGRDIHSGPGWGPRYGRRVTFRTMQWWKGDEQPHTIEIWTGYGGGDCGYPVEAGQSFLVYAYRTNENRFTMGICSRNAALVCAMRDLEQLGMPIKTYESIDRAELLAREQPYSAYWRTCLKPAQLIGERGLRMNKHCSYVVEGVIGTDGAVRDFRIVRRPDLVVCPQSYDAQLVERVAAWRFKPATIDGVPVETKLTRVSMSEPYVEPAEPDCVH